MKRIRITVGARQFFLDPDQDVDEAKAKVLAATERGPEFVDLRTVEHGVISVLVSSGLLVVFETIDAPDDGSLGPAVDPAPGHMSFVDWDL